MHRHLLCNLQAIITPMCRLDAQAVCDAQAMQAAAGSSNARLAQWVARQTCLALRNVAGRCPELRDSICGLGAERLLRLVHKQFPAACADVSSAALRDLGCDDYQCTASDS